MATFVFRNQIRNTLLVFVCALMAMGGTAHAVVLGLQDGNATVSIDVDSQHGLFDWTTDGVNIAPVFGGGINDYRQWFWYRVGNNPEQSIDTLARGITGVTDGNLDGNPDTAIVNYAGSPGFKIQVKFTLQGGTIGSGTSDIGEQISLVNTSQAAITMSFFQYGDFQLTPPLVGGEQVSFVNSNTVHETGAFGDVQETVHTPIASHQEAEPFPVTINELNDGAPTTLADNTASGPGDITWAYEWDVTINPGDSFLISKDMKVNVVVPEPSTWALVASAALLAVFMWSGKVRSLATKPR